MPQQYVPLQPFLADLEPNREWFRLERLHQRKTQIEVAHRLRVSQATVSLFERGHLALPSELLVRYAGLLGYRFTGVWVSPTKRT